jgi:hypothetical protein
MLVFDRASLGWQQAMETRYYLYPVHTSRTFLSPPTLAATLYLILMRLFNRSYAQAFRETEGCSVDVPFTPEEAFMANDEESYIKSDIVRAARNHAYIDTDAPLIFGVDPARLGGDKFKICHRKGRNVTKLYSLPPSDLETSKNRLKMEIDKYRPAIVNIDCGGLGVALYDALRADGYANIVRKVDFGGAATSSDKFKNKRAEMYSNAREWLLDLPCSIRLEAKIGDMLQSELSVVKPRWSNNSQLLMQPKEEIKKLLGYSPDAADAFVLTFAHPVARMATTNSLSALSRPVTAPLSWNPFA